MSGRHFLVESVSQKFLIEKLRNICCIKRYKVSADFFSLPNIYTLASPLHNKVFFCYKDKWRENYWRKKLKQILKYIKSISHFYYYSYRPSVHISPNTNRFSPYFPITTQIQVPPPSLIDQQQPTRIFFYIQLLYIYVIEVNLA